MWIRLLTLPVQIPMRDSLLASKERRKEETRVRLRRLSPKCQASQKSKLKILQVLKAHLHERACHWRHRTRRHQSEFHHRERWTTLERDLSKESSQSPLLYLRATVRRRIEKPTNVPVNTVGSEESEEKPLLGKQPRPLQEQNIPELIQSSQNRMSLKINPFFKNSNSCPSQQKFPKLNNRNLFPDVPEDKKPVPKISLDTVADLHYYGLVCGKDATRERLWNELKKKFPNLKTPSGNMSIDQIQVWYAKSYIPGCSCKIQGYLCLSG